MPSCPTITNYITGITLQTLSAANTYVSGSSGYTLATPVIGSIDTVSTVPLATILNEFTLIVTFGNGTVQEITQPTNSYLLTNPVVYNWPGEYEIKLSVLPKNGCPIGTFVKKFSAYNYIKDSITWNYSEWPELTTAALASGALFHGFQSCVPGNLGSPRSLTFNYTTANLASSNLVFNFYSENSLSQPWKISTTNNKYAQLRPRWRFTDLSGNYVDTVTGFNPAPVYINSTGNTVPAESGTLVGYSGSVSFNYIDDIPSLNYKTSTGWTVQTPRLWVTYETKNIPNLQDNNDSFAPSYSNSKLQLSAFYYVKNLSAEHFNLTLNGGSIGLPGVLWPGTSNEFIVSVNSRTISAYENFSNKTLLNYPLVAGQNIIIKSLPVAATTVKTPSFTLSRTDSLGRDTGGYYKNSLTTVPASSTLLSAGFITTTITASARRFTTINEPPPYYGNYTTATRISQATTYNSLSTITLSGNTIFDITNFNKKYFTRKINENFNYGEQLLKYALQPFIAANDNLFNFLSAAAGDNVHPDENFGTVTYEKIANFVANNNDIHTTNVDQLYSLTSLINTEFDNFNLNPPPVLKREFDLYSAPHERLWGNREKYNTNFNVLTEHTNLGIELTAYNIDTAVVSAGQKIVLNDINYSNYYELLEVPIVTSYASVTARGLSAYFSPTATYPLSSYPLSSFFGWGVKTPVKDNYRFYYYDAQFTNTPVNNLIDWNTRTEGLSTTLSETASSINDWYKDGGILENIYSYYITKGLGLTN